MEITNSMVGRANALAPHLTFETVKAMLNLALSGTDSPGEQRLPANSNQTPSDRKNNWNCLIRLVDQYAKLHGDKRAGMSQLGEDLLMYADECYLAGEDISWAGLLAELRYRSG